MEEFVEAGWELLLPNSKITFFFSTLFTVFVILITGSALICWKAYNECAVKQMIATARYGG